MAQLEISKSLAARLQRLAERENTDPESILEAALAQYEWQSALSSLKPPPPVYPEYPPRPRESLTDDDIEVPDDIEDVEGYREAARAIAPKVYEIAREYWQKVGDTERLALTDEQLDKVFWLIDHEGIPRFKSEKDQVQLPPDPMDALIGIIQSDDPYLSLKVDETWRGRFEGTHGDTD